MYWALTLSSLGLGVCLAAAPTTPATPTTAKPAARPAASKPAAKPLPQAPTKTNSTPAKAVGTKPGVHATTARMTTPPANHSVATKQNGYTATQSKLATTTRSKPQPQAQYTRYSNTARNRRQIPTSRTPVRSRQAYHPAQSQPTTDRYKEIQTALVQKGYLHGEPSGTWDADSTDAMKRFQKDQNLDADGKLSSLSLIALGLGPKRALTASAAIPPPPLQAPPVITTQPIPPPAPPRF